MKTKFILMMTIALTACGKTENESNPNPKKQDNRFWKNEQGDFNQKLTNHVDELVRKSSAKKDGKTHVEYTINYLDSKTLKKLNAKEVLYYTLAYPASYAQNCSVDAGDTAQGKIARYLPDQFCAHNPSTLQQNFMERHRDSIIAFLNNVIEKHPDKTDPAYLTIVRDMQAIECIPAIIKTASLKNNYNYTALVNLLTGYRPFMATGIYSKLYKDDNIARNVRIDASEENVKRICDLAMKMYNEQKIQ